MEIGKEITGGIGGLDFNTNCNEINFGKIVLKNFSEKEAEKLGLIEIATIPGMSFGHSLWRLTVHFKKEFKKLKGFSIIQYNKDKLGQEGAVRVMWWM